MAHGTLSSDRWLGATNSRNVCLGVQSLYFADCDLRLVAVAQHAVVERLLRSRADSEEHHWAFFCTARTDTATVVTRGQRLLKGAWSLSPHSMGDHHGIRCSRRSSRALEQGKDRWSEGAVQAQRHLGAARSPTDGEPSARACALQSGNRQQATRMRPGSPQSPRCLPWRPSRFASNCHAAQNSSPRPVRTDGDHS